MLSAITKKHWIELVVRSIIFLLTLTSYIVDKLMECEIFKYIVHGIVVIFFSYKMIAR